MTSNRYRLKHRAKLGDKNAQRIFKLLNQPDRLIGVILVGNNTVNTLAATIATIIGQSLAHKFGISNETSVGIAAGALTFLLLIFGEVGPKTYAATHPEKIATLRLIYCPFLLKILYPAVWLLNHSH
jgi:Mg2+/Co2+ transporter CorB